MWHDNDNPVVIELMQLPTGPNDLGLLCLDKELSAALVDRILNFLSSMTKLVYPSMKQMSDVLPPMSLNNFSSSLCIPKTGLQKHRLQRL